MADITIIMPSYNKEQYIADALDSIFMQKTSYNYQIIIADDCSTDKTIEIVKEYQQKYPNKIILLESTKNQKLYKNVIRAYENTKTKYFCVLDPDDYWIDEYKIQKALDFLEANDDYTIYVTGTDCITKEGNKKHFVYGNTIVDSTLQDFFANRAVLGCTLGSVYRNVIFINGLPEKMYKLETDTCEQSFRGDSFRNIIHLEKGKAHFVPEIDAIYRITDEGIWQGLSSIEQNILNANIFKDLWLYFDKKYPELLKKSYEIKELIDIRLIDYLVEINDAKKLKIVVERLKKLEIFFEEHKEALNQNSSKYTNKRIKFKYKVMLYLYKKFQRKLVRKGII